MVKPSEVAGDGEWAIGPIQTYPREDSGTDTVVQDERPSQDGPDVEIHQIRDRRCIAADGAVKVADSLRLNQ